MVQTYKISNAQNELAKISELLSDMEYDVSVLRQDKQKRREMARDLVKDMKKRWNNAKKGKDKLDDGKWVFTLEDRDELMERIRAISEADVI